MVRYLLPLRALALPVVIVVMQVGCRGHAEQRVRAIAAVEAAYLEDSPSVIDDPQVDAYLDGLGHLVLQAARRRDAPASDPDGVVDIYDRFDVVLVHSTSLNAWVYGDDFTCATTNLVLQAESPEEIVAVLCHEFAHLEEEHAIESSQREMTHYAWSSVIEIAGGVGDIAAQMYGVPISVSDLTGQLAAAHRAAFKPYRKQDEFEADLLGLELYASMGLALERYDDFFVRSIELQGDRGRDSHPRMSERLQRIDDHRSDLEPADPVVVLDRAAFEHAQGRLRQVLLALEKNEDHLTFEREMEMRAAVGWPFPPATSCGPLEISPRRLKACYRDALMASGRGP